MAAILQRRRSLYRKFLSVVVLSLLVGAHCAQAGRSAECPIEIQSLKDSAPLSSLAKDEQTRVQRALQDDIAEMAELDITGSYSSRAAYRDYFIRRLEFKAIPGPTPEEKLLLVRYNSNTMCGTDENCPVWIVRLTPSSARSMVPWQAELGSSAGGGWAVGIRAVANSAYPELILMTHRSSTQTGLACYRESKRHYLRVDCAPDCTRVLGHSQEDAGGK